MASRSNWSPRPSCENTESSALAKSGARLRVGIITLTSGRAGMSYSSSANIVSQRCIQSEPTNPSARQWRPAANPKPPGQRPRAPSTESYSQKAEHRMPDRSSPDVTPARHPAVQVWRRVCPMEGGRQQSCTGIKLIWRLPLSISAFHDRLIGEAPTGLHVKTPDDTHRDSISARTVTTLNLREANPDVLNTATKYWTICVQRRT